MARFPDRWQATQQASSSYFSEEKEWSAPESLQQFAVIDCSPADC